MIDNEETQIKDNIIKKAKKKLCNKWRKIGPIGKIYNIVVYIRSFKWLFNKFKASAEKSIPLDNTTK